MLKKLLTIILLSAYLYVNGQGKLHEIGIFAGTSYYMGELNQSKIFYEPSIALSALYKINFNDRYALRMSASYAQLQGDDAKAANKYPQMRDHRFNINISEFSTILEFSFLPYKPHSRFEYFSPYISLGIGIMLMPSEEGKIPIHPVIPFGIGFKYALTQRIGIAAEWTYRKTFTDYIDQIPQQKYSKTLSIENKQITNNKNKDWYSFAGITLTYKFALGNSKCRAYGN